MTVQFRNRAKQQQAPRRLITNQAIICMTFNQWWRTAYLFHNILLTPITVCLNLPVRQWSPIYFHHQDFSQMFVNNFETLIIWDCHNLFPRVLKFSLACSSLALESSKLLQPYRNQLNKCDILHLMFLCKKRQVSRHIFSHSLWESLCVTAGIWIC